MISLNIKISLLTIVFSSLIGYTQDENKTLNQDIQDINKPNNNSHNKGIVLNQDKKISLLLDLKKELNKETVKSEYLKIQVYSGNRSGAYKARDKFKSRFGNWETSIQYETPNFKIWVGNFRTRLEADKGLLKIKKSFPNAFIFEPKK